MQKRKTVEIRGGRGQARVRRGEKKMRRKKRRRRQVDRRPLGQGQGDGKGTVQGACPRGVGQRVRSGREAQKEKRVPNFGATRRLLARGGQGGWP